MNLKNLLPALKLFKSIEDYSLLANPSAVRVGSLINARIHFVYIFLFQNLPSACFVPKIKKHLSTKSAKIRVVPTDLFSNRFVEGLEVFGI
jgi:hypothetical protein